MNKIKVIGAGLAGCEAAWQIARAGVPVELFEMKTLRKSPAHHRDTFAELVCSNSLKASRLDSAAGLLKEEMRRFSSLCLASADRCSVAAGGALAVDRTEFSEFITERIRSHPNITVREEVVEELSPQEITVVATGPLTDEKLAESIARLCRCENLSFYDAAAPIVTRESVDMNIAFCASRYGKGGDDYINCPMNREEYEAFYRELISAETAPLKDFDRPLTVYEGCMPVEVLAKRGEDSIRFGPLKPVGLIDPRTGHRPWAAVQLRRENRAGSLFNLVGFQTNLKFPEQKRVFSMIPGLGDAQFVRYGVMHRNTFICSPKLLQKDLSLKAYPNLFFAGQLSGVEGYMESAASGIVAGRNALSRALKSAPLILPPETMIGSLLGYITDESVTNFQPMGANFGILPPLSEPIRDKRQRYGEFSRRSLEYYDQHISENRENQE